MITQLHRTISCTKPATPVVYKAFSIYKIIAIVTLFLINSSALTAQEINFEDFSSEYAVTISELSPAENLSFGMVIQNQGLVPVNIMNSKVLLIEGVKYLDVLVDIAADNYLFLDTDIACNGSNSNCIPFTLEAAFANRGINNTNQAVPMQVSSNIASARFPILARGNQPPGPPPTPVHEGYNPALYNETAYLYIYGSINVGTVDAGNYSGNITITVSYD